MSLLEPDQVDAHLRKLRLLIDYALDDHAHCAAYRWAYSGLSGVRSSVAGALGSPGHSDPVAAQAALQRVKQVEDAGNDLVLATKLVDRALHALREKDSKKETPTQLMRGWTPQKETEKLRENQARRQANGAGYGDS